MYRYKTSEDQRKAWTGMLFYVFFVMCVFAYATVGLFREGSLQAVDYFNVSILWFSAIFSLIWITSKLADDPLLGEYSFDSYGVTFYTKLHTTFFPFAECEDIGFTNRVKAGMFSNQGYENQLEIMIINLSNKVLNWMI